MPTEATTPAARGVLQLGTAVVGVRWFRFGIQKYDRCVEFETVGSCWREKAYLSRQSFLQPVLYSPIHMQRLSDLRAAPSEMLQRTAIEPIADRPYGLRDLIVAGTNGFSVRFASVSEASQPATV